MLNKTLSASGAKIKWALSTGASALFVAIILVAVLVYARKDNHRQISGVHFDDKRFNVELADTDPERVQGLSGRERLAKNSAMLFVFPGADKQCMWMKDMKFSLDMVWLDRSKKIVKIAEDVAPETYPQAFCADNTRYVLELNAGVAKETNLKIGQNLNF